MLEENELIVVNTEPIVRKCIEELENLLTKVAFKQLCDKDGACPAKAQECMHEYLNNFDDNAREKIFAENMEEKFKSSTRFQVQLSNLPEVPRLARNPRKMDKDVYQKKLHGVNFC